MAKKAVDANADTKKKIAQGFREIRNKKPYPMQVNDERGYIAENGLDREDRQLYKNNRNAFRNKVNSTVEKNTVDRLKEGNRYVNYSLVNAAKKTQQKKKR